MAGLLGKILPFARREGRAGGVDDEDDPNNPEYSLAVVYSGPVTHDVPRVLPIDITRIPIAAVVSSLSLDDVSLPIIQPIVKSSQAKKRRSSESTLGSATTASAGENVILKSTNGDEHRPELSNGICNNNEIPGGLVGNLKVLESHDDNDEDAGGDFQNYMIPPNRDSIESGLSSHSNSSEIFSGREEDCIEEAPTHVKRPSVVTFREPESNDVIQEESNPSESENHVPERPIAVRPGNKGTCYRCMKGNKFTDKEACIVCGAKYCGDCVVRAMGSMPEGRKCVTCIGHRIDEAKRETLGKHSGMLKRLFLAMEVKHIMESERTCRVNQLPPGLICVNGQRLSQEELLLLQTCQYPPKKLKKGNYWYDKVSGLWGKEGQKPCQIISPQLTVGGHIQKEASNGNTNIFINGREITKQELFMLQMAGVKCEGTTSFWVSADGSYQEEGMKKVRGKIWETSRARLVCAVLSLPVPPDSASSSGDEANTLVPNNLQLKSLHKLLLVGCKKSGTSTIFKQAKIIYNVPFLEDERQSIKSMIQSNLYGYIGILLEGREQFEEEILIKRRRNFSGCSDNSDNTVHIDDKTIYSIGPKLKNFSDWLLQVMMSGNLESIFPAATREYSHYVEDLWKDAAFQATYSRRSELELLPWVATYFLERAVEIAKEGYEPSDTDILYAEGITSSKGLSCMEFSYPSLAQDSCDPILYEHDPSLRYQLIRLHPRILGGNCKWLQMFEDVDMVLFCVSLTDYAEFSPDCSGIPMNKMMLSKQLFESIVTHTTFEDKKFLLILNKFDLLEMKIDEVPLSCCDWFHDFNPIIGHNPDNSRSRMTNPSLAHRAFQYIASKFKRLYKSLTDRKLYVSLVTGLKHDNVDEALRYAREILKWNEEEPTYPNQESSSASIEASSSS